MELLNSACGLVFGSMDMAKELVKRKINQYLRCNEKKRNPKGGQFLNGIARLFSGKEL
jgi:hypothetical protein